MTSETKAIILAGGLGTRLRPLTDTIPKCLVPIAGRPLLDHWVDRLVDAGVRRAIVNNHAHADQVRAYVKAVSASGRLQLDESYEPALLGSAGTIAANADLADGADAVVIVYADNFSDVDLERMLAFHRSHDDPFTMLLFRAPNPKACGIAELADLHRHEIRFEELSCRLRIKLPSRDSASTHLFERGAYRSGLRRRTRGPRRNGLFAGVRIALRRPLTSVGRGLSSNGPIAHRMELRGLGAQCVRTHDWTATGIERRKSARMIVAGPAVEIAPVDRFQCSIGNFERP